MKHQPLKLTLVTNKLNQPVDDYLNFISRCADAGITAVQLREKHLTKNKLLSFASALKKLLDTFQIPLIINDNLELCLTLNADGLHLGQNDGDITIARNLLGPDKIIGLTINTIEQVEHANQLPIDYIGIGSIFPTQHKADVQNIWGITELSKAVGLSCHPTIAIGGINISNANEVMRAGVFGIAAIGAFHQTKNLTETIQKLKKIVEGKPI